MTGLYSVCCNKTDQSPQSIVVDGGQFSQQVPVVLQLVISRLLLTGDSVGSLGHRQEIISQLLSQQGLLQLSDEPLENIGHVVFTVILPADLDSTGVGPELCQQFVDVDVAAGLPVDALGHDAVTVDELDALQSDNMRIVLLTGLLVSVSPCPQ